MNTRDGMEARRIAWMLRSPRCHLHKVTVRLSFLRSIASFSWGFLSFATFAICMMRFLANWVSTFHFGSSNRYTTLFFVSLPLSIDRFRFSHIRNKWSEKDGETIKEWQCVCECLTTCLNENLFLMYLIYSRRFSTKLDNSSNKSISWLY